MVKFGFKFIFTLCLLPIMNAYSADHFWQFYDKPRYFSLNFNIQQLGDLCRYQEYHSQSEGQIRRQFVNEAKQLMQAGAGGMEALTMVLAFDDRAFERRELSKFNVGKTLAQRFRSGLDKINQNFQEQGGTPLITFVNGRANYSVNLKWGTTANCNLYSTVVIQNDLTGVVRTFNSNGPAIHVDSLGYLLAMQVFHSLHHTKFPIVFNETQWEQKVFYHPTPMTLNGYKTVQQKVDFAAKTCRNRGRLQNKKLRLSTKNELELITSLPQYFGGINLPARNSGFVVLDRENSKSGQIFNKDHISGSRYDSGSIALKFEYICVEEVEK